MASEVLLELNRIDIALEGKNILQDIVWRLHKGENWLFFGPNGCGKTTLLRVIGGQLWPSPQSRGERLYHFENEACQSPVGLEGQITFLSAETQQHYLKQDWDLSGEEIVLTGLSNTELLYERPSNLQIRKARELISMLKLKDLAKKHFQTMSHGELRKILLARALADNPRLLLLDEFCHGLDPHSRIELLGLIDQILQQGKTQVVLTAHRKEEIPAGLTHFAQIADGKITRQGKINRRTNTLYSRAVPKPVSPLRRANSVSAIDIEVSRAEVYLDGKGGDLQRVLQGIDWRIRPGESWAITGPNGSGKSTLMKLLYGDVTCALGGEVSRRLDGVPLSVRKARKRMECVSAELQARFYRNGDVSVKQAIASGFSGSVGSTRNMSSGRWRRVGQELHRFGLENISETYLDQLSYGQVRKVLFARAVVSEPSILLLDEPLEGLDTSTRWEMIDVLENLVQDGRQLVMVSHHPEDFPYGMTHHLRLEGGRIAATGSFNSISRIK